jgi:hypothetical protein
LPRGPDVAGAPNVIGLVRRYHHVGRTAELPDLAKVDLGYRNRILDREAVRATVLRGAVGTA